MVETGRRQVLAKFIELYEAHKARVLIPFLSPGSFVVRFGEAGLHRIAVRFDPAKPAALFVIRRSIRDSGLAEYVALKETAEKGPGQVYDTGVIQIGNTRHLSGIADAFKKSKKGNISKLTQFSGLGLKQQGDGVMKDARYRRPITMGNGMRMSGGACCKGCGMEYNDKFIFENVSL
jgi:hypothetical protein